ncbi:GAD-like domain-containing protein [Rhizobium multihospitium]|uniref:GAD-like domain-containing protein n=1 Tax=Rhizobium multihospitium TaxID=410764 RepID=A0A1C3WXW4_9HYPH|nr:GAD-like domain-containing protein [Rhizobium multihospitium]SCB44862.1 GAD-like domain-containing protein [Rhizobium multihospitium]
MFDRLVLPFRRLALYRFVEAHSPSRQVSRADGELVAAYEGILPDSLLELWRRKGLGFYGEMQLALIDPRPWQAVLNRWIVSPPDDVRRVPIALTPFGVLLYYRKLTATDEDVVFIDPVSKTTSDLAWSLDDFFNRFLCDRQSLESLISPALLQSAREECGMLSSGEVYEIDQMLFSMQMLRIAKVDAFEMHRRLRDAVDPPRPTAEKPTTVADALPVEHRPAFDDIPGDQGLAGLYLSSYIDWHRLLALRPDGRYSLLFWRIHHRSLERVEVRFYTGTYETSRSAQNDEIVALDIRLRADSLGSDARDDRLVAMRSGGTSFLLRVDELGDIATAIGGWDEMGRSEYYFRRVTLDEAFVEEPSDGRSAPPFADLPHALKALVHVEPLRTTITHVEDPNLDEEDEGEGTVMCTLDLGEDDGLRHNMPLYSPPDTGRHLKGWIWKMAPHACKVGVKYRRGENGTIEHGPAIGDILTTRAPSER